MKKIYSTMLFCLLSLGQAFTQNAAVQDTLFKKPYVDVDEWRETPVKHRYVHGGFEGTKTRFSFYFSKSGAYFPTLRATSQRQGDAKSPFARIGNLGRVRVVVK